MTLGPADAEVWAILTAFPEMNIVMKIAILILNFIIPG